MSGENDDRGSGVTRATSFAELDCREIEKLSRLSSERERIEGLRAIVSSFGHVKSVLPLSAGLHDRSRSSSYLVNFERSVDAVAAARHLQCVQFALTSLVVSVPQIDLRPDRTERDEPGKRVSAEAAGVRGL
jgi:hypothetical protein